MKYELTNIPVLSAYETPCDCILCLLEEKLEKQYVTFFLGNSVMVPEMRVAVNRDGFCGRHLLMLYQGNNKLGLSLMLQTHLSEHRKADDPSGYAQEAAAARRVRKDDVTRLAALLEERAKDCLLCDRLDHTLTNYRYTIVKLFQTRDDYRRMLRSSHGFCLRHTPGLLRMATELLGREQLASLVHEVMRLRVQTGTEIVDNLEGFSNKFDYRNNEPMTSAERVSLSRAIRLLGARDVSSPD